MTRQAGGGLSPWGRREGTVRALIPVFCPADAAAPGLADRLVRHVELTASAFAPLTRFALFSAIDLIEAAGLRRGRPLSRLPLEARRTCVASLQTSGPAVRRLVGSVRDVVVIAYFDQPIVKDRLGYRPDEWTVAMKAARLHQWAAEIAAHEAVLRAPWDRPLLVR